MAKKKTALGAFEGLGNINLSGLTPSLNTKPFYPEVNHPDLLGIKPLGEQFVEALVPIQAELTRVTGELTKANERAGLAEERATVAESKTRRANIITLFISILAIAIPLIQGWYNDPKNQVKEQRLEKLSSIVEQQDRKSVV